MDKNPELEADTDVGTDTGSPDGGPGTYTGRVVAVPDHVRYVVFVLFGIQSRAPGAADDHVTALRRHFGQADPAVAWAPKLVERAHYVDAAGYTNDIFTAYWLDAENYRAWAAQPEVAAWWAGLPQDPASDVGFWREALMPDKDRFEFAAGNETKAASACFLDLKPCGKFGYWGGYRDRLPASRHDDFAAASDAPAEPVVRPTKGRRLTVVTPDNLCFLREGQGWSGCGAEERRIWTDKMEDVVTEWIGYLRDNPAQSGCLSIRDCREQDIATGAEVDRRSQFAFLLSLGHIEHAARTQPTHLAVHGALLKMYDEMPFEPQMHIWVEVSILKAGELETEYVNCHPGTGLLPYFELRDVTP
ncbi:MAG: phenylacetaldoxime dehydratase family protein [Rhodospirillales bacterium]|nr:phenylacetaldoxime dehydratase family protein [Rhodospirillales bacterium]